LGDLCSETPRKREADVRQSTVKRINSFIVAVPFLLDSVTPVLAHAMLDHASPRVGNTVASAPKEAVLWFTQKLEPAFSSVEVRNGQGVLMNVGKATVVGDRTQLRVPVKTLPPGTYKVIWRVLSVDTHRTNGDFAFRVGP
jgi:methionine-rich copper-binding protein CopC